jgi:restriction endonuclease S subunit
MINKLSELADIHIGQPIRDKIDNIIDGQFYIVQMKDVGKDAGVHQASLYRTNIKGRIGPRLVKKGDLLFVPRVFRESLPYSVIVDVDLKNLIVAPAFYVISVNHDLIRTEYLNWFINSESHGGKFFKRNAIGSSVLNIPKSVLTEMEIITPSLQDQDRFVKLIQATKTEKTIMESLFKKRVAFMNEAINHYIK